MTNWLDDFLNSRLMGRVVYGNYLEHLRLKNENDRKLDLYANVEEALKDFAQRTGLTEMQKRALRREVMIRIAVDFTQVNLEHDQQMIDSGDAPAAILPGVEPGSKLEKLIQLKKKRGPWGKERGLDQDQENDRFIEDNSSTQQQHSGDESQVEMNIGDAAQVVGDFQPGLVIEAVDEDPFATFREEPKEVPISEKPSIYQLKGRDKPVGRPSGPKKSYEGMKEMRLISEISELKQQLVHHYMEPGGTYKNPKWKIDQEKGKTKLWRARMHLESQIKVLQRDLDDIRKERADKEERQKPQNRAAANNVKFLTELDTLLRAKKPEARDEAIKKLSDEGMQELFDKAVQKFRKEMYHRPSQGYDAQKGDYVQCLVCQEEGNQWINRANPSILPFWHLQTHENKLLSDVDLWETKSGRYREEIVKGYFRKYPGAALQSREQELAFVTEKNIERARGKSATDVPHVATDVEKQLEYTDQVLLDNIQHQMNRFGVDPGDIDRDTLAQDILQKIKGRLEKEFPDRFLEEGEDFEIGRLESRGVPFMVFQKIFADEVGYVVQHHRGSILRTRAPTRRQKRRWTGPEKRQRVERNLKQVEKQDIIDELTEDLDRPPTKEELRDEMYRRNLVRVNLSVSGGRGCWNCGQKADRWALNETIAFNSVTCPNCGVYREVLISNTGHSKKPEVSPGAGAKGELDNQMTRLANIGTWECPSCGERKYMVVRDDNKHDVGGPKTYTVYCDEDYINGGPKAAGNSQYIHVLGRTEREIYKEIDPALDISEAFEADEEVQSDRYGYGRVAYVEKSFADSERSQKGHVWVDFGRNNPTHKLKDIKDQIVNLKSAARHWEGYARVLDVVVKEEEDRIMVSVKGHDGTKITTFYPISDINADVPVMTEVTAQDIRKIEATSQKRHHRNLLARKITGKRGCEHREPFIVDRYPKPASKKSSIREEVLCKRVLRARILKRI